MVQIINLFEKFDHFKYYTFDSFKESYLRRFNKQKRGQRYMMQIINTGRAVKNYYLHDGLMHVFYHEKYPTQHCGAGQQRVFGKNKHPERRWNNSYGWSCVACLNNHFKVNNSLDNSSCLPCPSMTLSTNDKSGCYDPYQAQHNDFTKEPILLLSVITCILGFILSLITIIVFVIFRTTPFIKASDIKSSCLHLVTMLLLFALFPYFFIAKPNDLECLFQPISILLFCICPSTLIVMKSQKILLAFKSKTRLTSSEKLKSTAKQYSVISIIILIDSSILLWTIMSRKPQVLVFYNHENYTKQFYCNTGHHSNMQITLLILQQIFSMIQAFRSRNLPGPFNEAMPIVYSSFISVVIYSIIFPIYYLQQDMKVKRFIHPFVVPTVHVSFILVFYGSKLYVVLLRPKKNTKNYFRAKMMEASQARVNSQMFTN